MGNICMFQDDTMVTSFQVNYVPQVSRKCLQSTGATQKSQQEIKVTNLSKIRQPNQPNQIVNNHQLADDNQSIKQPQQLRVRKVSVTPPSQHNLTMIRRLQNQSQVPSDFFNHYDMSEYFKTMRSMIDGGGEHQENSSQRYSFRKSGESKQQSKIYENNYVKIGRGQNTDNKQNDEVRVSRSQMRIKPITTNKNSQIYKNDRPQTTNVISMTQKKQKSQVYF